MKQVSLLAPTAADDIRKTYAGLADPKLLDQWANTPASAPGRLVSSPWPDRIEVLDVSERDRTATVTGTLIEMTSAGEAGRIPVRIALQRVTDGWLITGYETKGSARDAAPPQIDDRREAAAVITAYYEAINARDFRRAYSYWGASGTPQTFEEFEKGFADTASVAVTTGEPSRVEGAAGSRYIDVPVTITARTKSGKEQRFTGTYTLRRTVVDGTPESERRWHINGAKIR